MPAALLMRVMIGLVLALWPPVARAGDLVLMMFEQPGCLYCARWNAEVAPEYPLTDEGKAAPLVRRQLRDDLPAGVTLDRPAVFTPTFVLLRGGAEAGRIEGYPGEDFFWPLLGQLIRQAAAQGN